MSEKPPKKLGGLNKIANRIYDDVALKNRLTDETCRY